MDKFILMDFQEGEQKSFYDMAHSFYKSDAVGKEINQKFLVDTFEYCINKSPYIRGIFICCDNLIVGYALLTFTISNEYGGLIMFIDELYIKENYRNMGLGSYFISSLIFEYRQKVSCIELVVAKDNRNAINFYKKFDFVFNDFTTMYRAI